MCCVLYTLQSVSRVCAVDMPDSHCKQEQWDMKTIVRVLKAGCELYVHNFASYVFLTMDYSRNRRGRVYGRVMLDSH